MALRNNILQTTITKCRQYSALNKSFSPYNHIIKHHKPILINNNRKLFWERDRKGGYDTTIKQSNWEHIKNGFRELKHEIKLFGEEIKEIIVTDPLLVARPGKCTVYNETSTEIILVTFFLFIYTTQKLVYYTYLMESYFTTFIIQYLCFIISIEIYI